MSEQRLLPRFAVVGHPNKGKSSIVATLARDDTVYIDRVSGSTRRATHYPMSVDNQVLYELIDTPGFQRARAALEWLKQHCQKASERKQAIIEFYQSHQGNSDFTNECELLKPIIDGAGIIYVVDGSRPYGDDYHAEMEILRWTGAPSLALINPIDNNDYVEEWKNALGQYFSVVREFNAHRAEFSKRTSLLSLFGTLLEDWEEPLETAVAALIQERELQHRRAADTISAMIVDVLQHKESQKLIGSIARSVIEKALAEKYLTYIRIREKRCRREIESNYAYTRLESQEDKLNLEETDLIDQKSWYLFGLNKQQLVAATAGTGASAGALIDVGLGGSSLFLGSLIGGLAGATAGLTFSQQIAKMTVSGLPTGGDSLQYGPSTNLNFPFVLLGRALRHQEMIALRTHASREKLSIAADNPLKDVSAPDRIRLMSLFQDIRKNRSLFKKQQTLATIIYAYLAASDKS